MRKLRESESSCSGTISKSTSHSSIQSVCDEPEQNADADADPVAAPAKQQSTTLNSNHNQLPIAPSSETTTHCNIGGDSSSSIDCRHPTSYNPATKLVNTCTSPLGLETTTCGDDDGASEVSSGRVSVVFVTSRLT